MRIIVPVKYVPDIQSDRSFRPGGFVDRSAAHGTLNELDENAIEAALQIIEALPAQTQAESEVVAVTVGPQDADIALRKAFQLGVDRGVRVSDTAISGSDIFATARVLTKTIDFLSKDHPFDLIITGMAALDGLGSVVGAIIAQQLNVPQLTLATKLELAGSNIQITRDYDGVTEVLAASLPALVGVTDHLNAPRYPNVKLIMAARTKQIDVLSLADLGLAADQVGVPGSFTEMLSAEVKPPKEAAVKVLDEGQGGIALAEYLINNKLI